MSTARLYLAGFEVFAPDGEQRATRMREIVIASGLEPLSPLDGDKSTNLDELSGHDLAMAIFRINVEMIERADVVVGNLNPFRGPDPDAGTCWEVGYGHGRGKATYVYTEGPRTAIERTEQLYPPVTRREDGSAVDRDQMTIENFGHPFNLMLACCGTYVHGDFAECIRTVAADVAAGKVPVQA
ncbi:nucleoside 2-deoxyribosyltransferase [Kineosporia sp. J2-2]|uniref:Nucleoside 2-deoxyribosyltransferase n=1 Tax=Kineosporia corallincola TaxID=2835133 RepID=A0ABS5TPX2_9ACTN|nr:nucleoside 2-deoxyribosyltransferase [Kineosporia corallincola]MBT0773136.1 nucleoside 2-deoxyribosyltransferase [Kineosporia corallincola]